MQQNTVLSKAALHDESDSLGQEEDKTYSRASCCAIRSTREFFREGISGLHEVAVYCC